MHPTMENKSRQWQIDCSLFENEAYLLPIFVHRRRRKTVKIHPDAKELRQNDVGFQTLQPFPII